MSARLAVTTALTAVAVVVLTVLFRDTDQATVEQTVMHWTRYLWAAILIVAVITVYVVLSHLYPKKEY